MGVAVSHASLLAQCQALTQACGYTEGKGMWVALQLCRGTWMLSCVGGQPRVASAYSRLSARMLGASTSWSVGFSR